jgi:hypothetical protein
MCSYSTPIILVMLSSAGLDDRAASRQPASPLPSLAVGADPGLVAELRHFRIGVLTVVALPWVAGLLITPFVSWHWSLGLATGLTLRLLFDALLVLFAWRRPIGIASALIVLRLVTSAALTLAYGRSVVSLVAVLVDAAFAVLLLWLAVPLRRRAPRLRAELRETERIHIDARYAKADRRASARRYARLERRGQP